MNPWPPKAARKRSPIPHSLHRCAMDCDCLPAGLFVVEEPGHQGGAQRSQTFGIASEIIYIFSPKTENL